MSYIYFVHLGLLFFLIIFVVVVCVSWCNFARALLRAQTKQDMGEHEQTHKREKKNFPLPQSHSLIVCVQPPPTFHRPDMSYFCPSI